jgi:hypothetical protein
MNPATLHPDLRPASQPQRQSEEPPSFLEPGGEGILFSVVCLLASALVYGAVLLFEALK